MYAEESIQQFENIMRLTSSRLQEFKSIAANFLATGVDRYRDLLSSANKAKASLIEFNTRYDLLLKLCDLYRQSIDEKKLAEAEIADNKTDSVGSLEEDELMMDDIGSFVVYSTKSNQKDASSELFVVNYNTKIDENKNKAITNDTCKINTSIINNFNLMPHLRLEFETSRSAMYSSQSKLISGCSLIEGTKVIISMAADNGNKGFSVTLLGLVKDINISYCYMPSKSSLAFLFGQNVIYFIKNIHDLKPRQSKNDVNASKHITPGAANLDYALDVKQIPGSVFKIDLISKILDDFAGPLFFTSTDYLCQLTIVQEILTLKVNSPIHKPAQTVPLNNFRVSHGGSEIVHARMETIKKTTYLIILSESGRLEIVPKSDPSNGIQLAASHGKYRSFYYSEATDQLYVLAHKSATEMTVLTMRLSSEGIKTVNTEILKVEEGWTGIYGDITKPEGGIVLGPTTNKSIKLAVFDSDKKEQMYVLFANETGRMIQFVREKTAEKCGDSTGVVKFIDKDLGGVADVYYVTKMKVLIKVITLSTQQTKMTQFIELYAPTLAGS